MLLSRLTPPSTAWPRSAKPRRSPQTRHRLLDPPIPHTARCLLLRPSNCPLTPSQRCHNRLPRLFSNKNWPLVKTTPPKVYCRVDRGSGSKSSTLWRQDKTCLFIDSGQWVITIRSSDEPRRSHNQCFLVCSSSALRGVRGQ